jgi:hypothetical protein
VPCPAGKIEIKIESGCVDSGLNDAVGRYVPYVSFGLKNRTVMRIFLIVILRCLYLMLEIKKAVMNTGLICK